MKRTFESVAKMKVVEDALERDQLVPKVDRAALFSSPTTLTYEKPPEVSPLEPTPKPSQAPLHEPKKG